MILRAIVCDVCGVKYTEANAGSGFPGWGSVNGMALDGIENPSLCPTHLAAAALFLDDMKKINRGDES